MGEISVPLQDAGMRLPTLTGENAKATDLETNTPVVVSVTREALDDYGWGTAMAAASDKFDHGNIAQAGPPPVVTINSKDCEDWSQDDA